MSVEESIMLVLTKEGKFSEVYAKKLTNQILDYMTKLGRDVPTHNLLWSTIAKETGLTRDGSQILANYIIELIETGEYETELDKILKRIRKNFIEGNE
jgi:hypothetical protein